MDLNPTICTPVNKKFLIKNYYDIALEIFYNFIEHANKYYLFTWIKSQIIIITSGRARLCGRHSLLC
jgi:hypothetical protein